MSDTTIRTNPDVILIGAGIMSATLGVILKELQPKHPEINFIKKGSALKFFDLAEGKADAYPRFAPTMEWDIAAGQAILEALGGTIVHATTNQSLVYNKSDLTNPSFLAKSNALLKMQ